jgi:hypothetical protein
MLRWVSLQPIDASFKKNSESDGKKTMKTWGV